jgi:hypothetical protein
LTVNRRPNIILLTDGEPTFAWNSYDMLPGSYAPNSTTSGTGQGADLGMDILTVATAAYWKQMVTDNYYGTSTSSSATFYTIGVGTAGNAHALAVMDPENNAQGDTQFYSGTTYNMKDVLDAFVSSAAPVSFPSWNGYTNASRALFSIANTGQYVKDYHYTDGFYPAEDQAALDGAFANIAQKIITSGAYATSAGQGDADPNFYGNVVFQDVIGEGMELKRPKGFYVYDQQYDSTSLANDLIAYNNGTTTGQPAATWNTYIDVLVNRLGITAAQAEGLILSAIARGSITNTASEPMVVVSWYAASDPTNGLVYLGNYCDATGDVQSAPAGATCLVELYSVEGKAQDPVTGEETDLMYLYSEMVTAFSPGSYTILVPDTVFDFQISLAAQQQAIYWYIPASLVPQRTVKPTYASGVTPPPTGIEIVDVSPIRACYTVGLCDYVKDASGEMLPHAYPNAAGDGYYLYTNSWNTHAGQDNSRAVFEPNTSNPYYFYTGDDTTDGKTYLYTESDGNYTLATSYTAGISYYTQIQYFDQNAAATNFIKTDYAPLDQSIVPVSGTKGQPYIAYGTPRPLSQDVLTEKTTNPTGTLGYSISQSQFDLFNGAQQFLGNNGRLEVLLTEVPVKKYWEPADSPGQSVWASLSQTTQGVTTPLGTPIQLDAANNWQGTFSGVFRYALDPKDGAFPLINYSILEGDYDGTTFTSWGNSGISPSGDFKIDIIQPVWNSGSGTWQGAEIDNILKPHLIIVKNFEGLPAESYPAGLEFEVTGSDDAGTQIFHKVIKYADFRNGRYILGKLTPGTYTVVEHSKSAEVKGYTMVSATPTDGYKVVIAYGGEETVKFTNAYKPVTSETPAKPPSIIPATGDNAHDATRGIALLAALSLLLLIGWALGRPIKRQHHVD